MLTLWLTVGLSSCHRDDPQLDVLQTLYLKYENGEINQCNLGGVKVYVAGINAYDAGAQMFDIAGNQIGICNYAWGLVDPICGETSACEVIYRTSNHISGQPEVDVYNLTN